MTTEPTWSGSAGPTAVSPAGRVAPGTARVEAFSDGVLAVAITLLVLDLKVPHVEHGSVWPPLLDQWPGYAAYVTSFLSIGIMWMNHHSLFVMIARADRKLLFVNLLLLLLIVTGAVQHVAGGGVPHPPRLQRQDRYGHLQRAVVPDGAWLRGAVGVSVDPPAPARGWGRRGGGAACVPAVRDRLGRVRGPGGGVVPQPCGRAGVACVSGRLLRLRTTPGRAARRWPSRLSCRRRQPATPSISCAVAQLRRRSVAPARDRFGRLRPILAPWLFRNDERGRHPQHRRRALGQPPVGVAEDGNQRRDQQRPDEGRVQQDAHSQAGGEDLDVGAR